uniref:Uncharacterized protein n=1 Tax=Salix viminalis TaxID=40686 RepID=A0A6N2N3X3_SALVM
MQHGCQVMIFFHTRRRKGSSLEIHTGEEFSLIMKSASGCKALQRRCADLSGMEYYLCIYASIQSLAILATQFIAATCLSLSF